MRCSLPKTYGSKSKQNVYNVVTKHKGLLTCIIKSDKVKQDQQGCQ